MGTSRPSRHKLLSAVSATGAGEWVRAPLEKVFEVDGITTATVKIQWRSSANGVVNDLTDGTFTADGSVANRDATYEVRANVTAYTSGTISVWMTSIAST